MTKKSMYGVLLALLIALTVMTSGVLAQEEAPDLVRLTVDNRTDETLAISLSAEGLFFYLPVDPESTRVFTVPRGDYSHTTYACSKSVSGTMDLSRQLELIFPSCFEAPANQGEPSIEKIYLSNDAPNSKWQFQID